jgi:ferredoxin-fold anticodon binding domain-containing protein
METALKKSIGQRIRLYTASGVESYLGVLTEVHEDYVTLRDDRHDEEMFIALPHIESFHVAQNKRAGTRKR